jgi:hypothetical protein
MANEISLKDQLSALPTLTGDDNYPMWNRRISAFLKHRDLFKAVNTAPGENLSATVKLQQSESANILLTKISNKLFNRIITESNNNVGFLIWTHIKDLFAKRTGLCISCCLTQWHRIKYSGNLTEYLDQVEAFLATFDSISYVEEGSAICGVITSALSEEQRSLTNPILTNDKLMNDPVMLLTKLRDIAYNEKTRKRPHSEQATAAVATNSCCTRPPPGCANGVHNPAATHPEHNCWAIYPEKKPLHHLKNPTTPASQLHTTSKAPQQSTSQHEQPVFSSITMAIGLLSLSASIPAVLDSGASHHMFNDLCFFLNTGECSIPINTGRNSTNLTATRRGVAVISQTDGTIL